MFSNRISTTPNGSHHQPIVEQWKVAGAHTIWAWSHELSGLPEELVPDSREVNWSAIEPFLQDKYQRFLLNAGR